ncbi:MAG: tyrosine-type recombinase/integrase [Acidobacteriota bacterium]
MTYQDEFTMELRYIRNVSPNTLELYSFAFKQFQGCLESKTAVIGRIGELRDRGVKPVSVNTYLRCVNAYFNWLHKEHGKELVKIPKLKEEQKVLESFSSEHVSRFLNYKPKTFASSRLHTIVSTLLDTGIRINEALSLAKEDVDMDNLVLKIAGKGGKHRLVPFSAELRRLLFRWSVKSQPTSMFFETKRGAKLSQRNFLRDFKEWGEELKITGVRVSAHTCRHTFAIFYLRKGGNLFYLSRILGHSDIKTTQRYLQSLGIEDLQAVHNRLSLLAR